MTTKPLVISGDSHIVEPPDMYTSGMPKSMLHKTPQMRRYKTDDGREADAWFIGDEQVVTLGAVTQAGRRFDDKAELDFVEVWDDVRHGAYRPDAMIEELELDGVWGAVLQPSQGLFWYHLDDTELLTGIKSGLQRLDRRLLLQVSEAVAWHRHAQCR